MSYPIPIQTNHGVVHLYCKNQLPIIGTHMTKSKNVIIIISESKKYCGFLSDQVYKIKNYASSLQQEGSLSYRFFAESGFNGLTENELIKYPCECMKPFKIIENNDSVIPFIYIDFVSFPRLCQETRRMKSGEILEIFYDEHNTSEFVNQAKQSIPYNDLTVSFQLKLYEYDYYTQTRDVINMNTFENDPKLAMKLKML